MARICTFFRKQPLHRSVPRSPLVLELLEDRRKTTIIHALRQFKQRDRIRTVVIDLSARMVAESGWSYRREEVAQRIFKNDKKISK